MPFLAVLFSNFHFKCLPFFLSGNQSNIVFIQLRRKSRLFARSQWRLVELHDMEKGGGRKFSKTFFLLKGFWKSSVTFSGEGDTRRRKTTLGKQRQITV